MKITASEACLTVRLAHLAGSGMSIGLSITGCLHSKKQIHVRKQDWLHCSPKVRAAATSKTWRDSYRACFGSPIENTKGGSASAGWTFTTRTRTHLISLPYSRLLATTNGRSYLVRPVSLSSWLINVVAGPPLENLSFLVSQGSSWEKTVSFLLLQQRPLNFIRRIWKLVETEGRSPFFPGYMISPAHVATCNGESKTELDSGFQTVDSGSRVLDSLPVERHRDSGFFWAESGILNLRIPDSTRKKFHRFQIPKAKVSQG